jgi:hypothetical protein
MPLELGNALGIPIPKQVAMQLVAAFAGLSGASLLKLIPLAWELLWGSPWTPSLRPPLTGALGTLYIIAMVKLGSVMKELELVLPSEELLLLLLRTVFSSVSNKQSVQA